MKWYDRYKASRRGPLRVVVHADCGEIVEPVQICSHCGGELTPAKVRSELGPGASAAQREAEARLRAAAA